MSLDTHSRSTARKPGVFSFSLGRAISISVCARSEEHTSELQSQSNLVCRLMLEKQKMRYPRISPMSTPTLDQQIGKLHKISEDHTAELQSLAYLVRRLLLAKNNQNATHTRSVSS